MKKPAIPTDCGLLLFLEIFGAEPIVSKIVFKGKTGTP